jgi:hypothetical protein
MLALGVFLPYVHIPLAGPVNLFFNGRGVGVFLLVAGVLGFLAILRRSQVLAGFLGISSLGTLVVHFFVVRHRLQEAAERAERDLSDSPFAALATGAIDAVQVQSGFGVMLVGAALLVVGGFLSKFNQQSSAESARRVAQKVTKVQTWVTGTVRASAGNEPRRASKGDDHERNAWVREQFELWLAAESRQQPGNASERLALFADFKARLERGEIDMVALRKASAASRMGEPGDATSSGRTDRASDV